MVVTLWPLGGRQGSRSVFGTSPRVLVRVKTYLTLPSFSYPAMMKMASKAPNRGARGVEYREKRAMWPR